MMVVSINRWGTGGIQVNFELVLPGEGMAVNHTEMAIPDNLTEFNRLMDMRLYEKYDIDSEKVVSP
jgi:hypothetical protein